MSRLFFFDDQHIAASFRLSRCLNHPQKVALNPLITATEDWEALLCTYGSVIYDEGLFKAYYTIWWLQSEPPYDCLAEGLAYAYSSDGMHWIKPDLHIVPEVNGGRNNLIRYGMFADQPCVLRLPQAQGDYAYAMAYYGDFAPLGPGVRICFSTDGIHWDWPGTLVWKTAIDAVAHTLDFYAADDTINFYFDPARERYVLLRKVMDPTELLYDPARHAGWQPDPDRLLRMIARCESTDLLHWTDHQTILVPDRDDPPAVDFHRLGVTPYAAGYLGLLEMHNGTPGQDSIALDLVYSADSRNWARPCRTQQPFIANGPADAWDGGVIFTPPQFLVHGEELFFYYGGMQAHLTAESMGKCQRFGVGLATLPKDRLCSLRATHNPGLLISTPQPLHTGVQINALIADAGTLQVALRSPAGDPLPGFGWEDCDPLGPDLRQAAITWHGRALPDPGTYQIAVRAQAADLYALDVV